MAPRLELVDVLASFDCALGGCDWFRSGELAAVSEPAWRPLKNEARKPGPDVERESLLDVCVHPGPDVRVAALSDESLV
jgi:hypothetical protein